jgi:hypothetical protein
MAGRVRPGRPPVLLVTFIVGAVAFGAAAVLLSAPLPPPPAGSTGSGGMLTLTEAGTLAEVVLVALIAVPLVMFLFNRSSGTMAMLSRPVSVALLVILLLTAFVFFSHYIGGGTSPGQAVPPGNNSSGGLPPGGGNTTTNESNVTRLPFGVSVPPWALYLAVAAIGLVGAVLVVPWVLNRQEPPTSARRRDAELRADLTAAIAALSETSEGTPRERIIQVYARWLKRLVRGSGDLSILTAREIESMCVERLGVTPTTAHELTALFEEARYSTHPMGEDAVARAQAALNAALAEFDLRRVSVPGPAT